MSPIDAALLDKPLPVELLDQLTLLHGSHRDRAHGVCLLEAAAWLAGERHSDCPDCACPVVGIIGRRVNDWITDDEERTRLLRPLLVQIAGSKSTRDVEIARGCAAADWTVRTVAPAYMELRAESKDLAARLRAISPLVTRDDCREALPELRAIREEAWRRRKAAYRVYRNAADAAAAAAAAAAADASAAAAAAAAAADAADAAAAAAADAAAADAADAAADAADADADAAAAADAAWYWRSVGGGVGTDALTRVRTALSASGVDLLRRMLCITPDTLPEERAERSRR